MPAFNAKQTRAIAAGTLEIGSKVPAATTRLGPRGGITEIKGGAIPIPKTAVVVDLRKRPMSEDHKRKIAEGRRRAAAIRASGDPIVKAATKQRAPSSEVIEKAGHLRVIINVLVPIDMREAVFLHLQDIVPSGRDQARDEGFRDGWKACAALIRGFCERQELQVGKPTA